MSKSLLIIGILIILSEIGSFWLFVDVLNSPLEFGEDVAVEVSNLHLHDTYYVIGSFDWFSPFRIILAFALIFISVKPKKKA